MGDAPSIWESLAKRMLGDTLAVSESESQAVNGLSISPKRGFCIIKIWTSDEMSIGDGDDARSRFRLPDRYRGEVIYRRNIDNIQNDNKDVQKDVQKDAFRCSSGTT